MEYLLSIFLFSLLLLLPVSSHLLKDSAGFSWEIDRYSGSIISSDSSSPIFKGSFQIRLNNSSFIMFPPSKTQEKDGDLFFGPVLLNKQNVSLSRSIHISTPSLTFDRQIESLLRIIDTYTNPSSTPTPLYITLQMRLPTDTSVIKTMLGGDISTQDKWFITHGRDGGIFVGYHLFSSLAPQQVTVNGGNTLSFSWNVILPANGDLSLMFFASQSLLQNQAEERVAEIQTLPPFSRSQIPPEIRFVNWEMLGQGSCTRDEECNDHDTCTTDVCLWPGICTHSTIQNCGCEDHFHLSFQRSPFDGENPQSIIIPPINPITVDLIFELRILADLRSATQNVSLLINGFQVGFLFDYQTSRCTSFTMDRLILSPQEFLSYASWETSFNLELVPSSSVDIKPYCTSSLLQLEIFSATSCHDGDMCTSDYCSQFGECQFVIDEHGCDDGIECTIEKCVDGVCIYTPNSQLCDSAACAESTCLPYVGCIEEKVENCECEPSKHYSFTDRRKPLSARASPYVFELPSLSGIEDDFILKVEAFGDLGSEREHIEIRNEKNESFPHVFFKEKFDTDCGHYEEKITISQNEFIQFFGSYPIISLAPSIDVASTFQCLNTYVQISVFTPHSCNDGSICTRDECIDRTCDFIPLTDLCDDGIACTKDMCVDGDCVHHPEHSLCDPDGSVCERGVCLENEGCSVVYEENCECDAGKSFSFTFTSSPFDNQHPAVFSVSGIPSLTTEVILDVAAQGDLGLPIQAAKIRINSTNSDSSFEKTVFNSYLNGCLQRNTGKFVIPASSFFDLVSPNTPFTVEIIPTKTVQPKHCPDSYLQLDIHSPLISCNDQDLCTKDTCNSDNSCSFPLDLTFCDDGFECTTDFCNGSRCSYTTNDTLCDDGDPCTLDICSTEKGCIHETILNCKCSESSFYSFTSDVKSPFDSSRPQSFIIPPIPSSLDPQDVIVLRIRARGDFQRTVERAEMRVNDVLVRYILDESLADDCINTVETLFFTVEELSSFVSPNQNFNLTLAPTIQVGRVVCGRRSRVAVDVFSLNSCNDGDFCTSDWCESETCTFKTAHRHCDDDIPCTQDSCSANSCINHPISALCNDRNESTIDVCDDTRGCINYVPGVEDCSNIKDHFSYTSDFLVPVPYGREIYATVPNYALKKDINIRIRSSPLRGIISVSYGGLVFGEMFSTKPPCQEVAELTIPATNLTELVSSNSNLTLTFKLVDYYRELCFPEATTGIQISIWNQGSCNDGDLCTLDTCDPDTLLCVFSNETQPSSCDDKIECTRDFCEASTCVHKPVHEVCQSGGLCEEFCDIRWGCQSLTCQIPTVQPTVEKVPDNKTIPTNPPPPGRKSQAPKLYLTFYALFALQLLLFIFLFE